jgi:hypothetical protein
MGYFSLVSDEGGERERERKSGYDAYDLATAAEIESCPGRQGEG